MHIIYNIYIYCTYDIYDTYNTYNKHINMEIYITIFMSFLSNDSYVTDLRAP